MARKGELEATPGHGLMRPKMAWRRGSSQIGAHHDAIQSGEVAVETLATGRTHEREELMAGAHARAPSGRDVTTVGRGAAGENTAVVVARLCALVGRICCDRVLPSKAQTTSAPSTTGQVHARDGRHGLAHAAIVPLR